MLRHECLVQYHQKNDSGQKHDEWHEKMAVGKDGPGASQKSHMSKSPVLLSESQLVTAYVVINLISHLRGCQCVE